MSWFLFSTYAEQRFDLNSLFTILYENTVLKYSRLSSVRRSTGFIETIFFHEVLHRNLK